ncbi:hypothetical protein MHYP_G00171000 [Metynnis hypsauchen]
MQVSGLKPSVSLLLPPLCSCLRVEPSCSASSLDTLHRGAGQLESGSLRVYREKSCSSNMTSEETHSSVPAASQLSLQISSGSFTDQCERVKLQEGLGGTEVGCGSPCWTVCLTDCMVDHSACSYCNPVMKRSRSHRNELLSL